MTRKEINMKKNGGPAFPQNDACVNRINNLDGMSLRDYFAAQALIALIGINDEDARNTAITSHAAYCYADEMLKRRIE